MIRVAVNPDLLRWARKRSGIPRESLAAKFNKLPELEDGVRPETAEEISAVRATCAGFAQVRNGSRSPRDYNGALEREATLAESATVRGEGGRSVPWKIEHFSLDVSTSPLADPSA